MRGTLYEEPVRGLVDRTIKEGITALWRGNILKEAVSG